MRCRVCSRTTQDVDGPANSRRSFSIVSTPSHGTLTRPPTVTNAYTADVCRVHQGRIAASPEADAANEGGRSRHWAEPAVERRQRSASTVTGPVSGPSCLALLTATVGVGSTTLFPHNCTASSGGGRSRVTAVTPARRRGNRRRHQPAERVVPLHRTDRARRRPSSPTPSPTTPARPPAERGSPSPRHRRQQSTASSTCRTCRRPGTSRSRPRRQSL